MRYFFLFMLVVILAGCSTADTTGPNTERTYDAPIKINSGGGDVTLTVNLNASSEADTESSQTPSNTASTSTDTQIPMSLKGSTSGTGGQVNPQSSYTPDNRVANTKVNSENQTSTETTETINIRKELEEVEKQLDESIQANEETIKALDEVSEILGNQPYQVKFHHTGVGGSDGGTRLALCADQKNRFDKCTCNGVDIPWHGFDNGKPTYWAMKEELKGDIICERAGEIYRYPAGELQIDGKCNI